MPESFLYKSKILYTAQHVTVTANLKLITENNLTIGAVEAKVVIIPINNNKNKLLVEKQ